jgi:hypothetical protein
MLGQHFTCKCMPSLRRGVPGNFDPQHALAGKQLLTKPWNVATWQAFANKQHYQTLRSSPIS